MIVHEAATHQMTVEISTSTDQVRRPYLRPYFNERFQPICTQDVPINPCSLEQMTLRN